MISTYYTLGIPVLYKVGILAEWCGRQAVLEVVVAPGSTPTLVLDLEYSAPRLWTLHLADAYIATGYQGANYTEVSLAGESYLNDNHNKTLIREDCSQDVS